MKLVRLPPLLAVLLVGVVYYLTALFGLLWSESTIGSPIWPAAGVALAGILLFGYRVAFAVAVAAFLTVVGADLPLSAKLAAALGHTLEPVLGALLIRQAGCTVHLDRAKDVVSFVLSVTVAAVLGALGDSIALGLDAASLEVALASFRYAWLAELLGLLLVAPLLLAWLAVAPQSRPMLWSFLAACAVAGLVVALGTLARLAGPMQIFTFFPLLLWAVTRQGQRGCTLVLFLFAAFSLIRLVLGLGLPRPESLADGYFVWQQFLIILGVTFLFFSAIVEERTRAAVELLRSRELVELAHQAARIGVFELNLQTGVNTWSAELEKMYGLPVGGFAQTQTAWESLVHREDRAAATALVARAFETDVPAEGEWRVVWPDGSTHWLFGRFQVFLDDRGKPARLIGINIDITERKLAEQALRQNEARFRKLAEEVRLIPWEADARTWCFTYVGPRAVDLLGYPVEAWSAPTFWADHIHPDDREEAVCMCVAGSRDLDNYEFEYRMLASDGRTVWFRDVVHVVRDQTGPVTLRGVLIDITGRKQAENVLREREEQLHLFIEHSPVALAMFDRDMSYLEVSNRWKSDMHLGQRDLRGLSHYAVFPEIPERWKEIHRRGMAGEVIRADEDRFDRADGSVQWLRWEVRPWHDATGAVGGIVIYLEEITERKLAEERLREREALLGTLTAHAQVGIVMVTAEHRYVFANAASAEVLGVSTEEIVGRRVADVLAPVYESQIRTRLDRAFAGERVVYELTMPPRQDTMHDRIFAVTFDRPVETAHGPCVIVVVVDITERKRAEEAVAASERMLRLVLDNIPQGVFWKDRHSRYLGCNRVVARSFGLASRDEVIGRDDHQLPGLTAEQAEFFISKDLKVMESDTPEYDIIEPATLADGSSIWMQTSKVPMHDGRGQVIGLLGTWQDITQRKRDEEALRENEERLSLATEAADIGFFDWNVQRNTVYYSARWKSQLGYAPEEVADCWESFESRLHPDDREALLATVTAYLAKPWPNYCVEFRMRHKDSSYRTIQTRAVLVPDSAGRPLRMLGTHLDITEHKRAEDSIRASLREKETLLKEVHHRVKNNLAVVDSLLSLQAGRVRDPHAAAVLRDACNRVHSMALIHETLYRAPDLARIDLPAYIRRLCDHLFDSFGVDRATIHLQLAIEPLPIDLERAVPIGLLINELASNILKHAFCPGDVGQVSILLCSVGDDQTQLTVADTGVGLPRDTNVLEARTLGLRLVHSLARQIGGVVEFGSSEPRIGTVAVVTFPSSPDGV